MFSEVFGSLIQEAAKMYRRQGASQIVHLPHGRIRPPRVRVTTAAGRDQAARHLRRRNAEVHSAARLLGHVRGLES
ncbi:MAG: hypothetical protein WCJ09_17085 [Planctomycetota bacterium]